MLKCRAFVRRHYVSCCAETAKKRFRLVPEAFKRSAPHVVSRSARWTHDLVEYRFETGKQIETTYSLALEIDDMIEHHYSVNDCAQVKEIYQRQQTALYPQNGKRGV